jgi:DNA-directed RNA polymerase subunit H (RpoH/RPB5)
MNILREIRNNPQLKGIYTEEVQDKKELSIVVTMVQTYFNQDGGNNYIIIINGNSSNLLKDLLDLLPTEFYSKVFFADELKICPMDNILVPTHRLATEEEIRNLHKRHILLNTLPIILISDKVARWYGWKVKTIIAIERPDGIYFRRVVSTKKTVKQ